MSTAYATIKNMFPRAVGQKNGAVTGYIPISVFDAEEETLRPLMREVGLKAYYRGPRVSNNMSRSWVKPGMTRRCDAEGVYLYFKL